MDHSSFLMTHKICNARLSKIQRKLTADTRKQSLKIELQRLGDDTGFEGWLFMFLSNMYYKKSITILLQYHISIVH